MGTMIIWGSRAATGEELAEKKSVERRNGQPPVAMTVREGEHPVTASERGRSLIRRPIFLVFLGWA